RRRAPLDWTRPSADLFRYAVYFWPDLPLKNFAGLPAGASGTVLSAILVESTKWCMVFAIAVWLTVALLAAWWQVRKTRAAQRDAAAAEGLNQRFSSPERSPSPPAKSSSA